jgi:hypothetical protein
VLPFARAADYNALHQEIAYGGKAFTDVRKNYLPQGLRRLMPAYDDYKYWHRLLLSDDATGYPARAWKDMLPITATLTPRIEFVQNADAGFRVAPIPRVIMYPFGWSSWISLRITGPHTLDQLANLVQSAFNSSPFKAGTATKSLPQLMKMIADWVRADGYGGVETADVMPSEFTVVTTVLAKHNGSPSIAVPGDDEPALRALIEPTSNFPTKTLGKLVFRFDPQTPFEFMLAGDYIRFFWMEHLLTPDERNRHLLGCYHQNNFRLLVHCRQLLGLLSEVMRQKVKTASAFALAESAVGFLNEPTFKNASLRSVLDNPKVQKLIERALKWVDNQS